jgi:thiamine biosynthesis lipoprotein
VELGGDIRMFGNTIGESWRVGIRDPHGEDLGSTIAFIKMQQGGLATSGEYERYSLIKGKKYSHILNPLTGWPVEGLSSVSVLADQCIVAGSAASIAELKGKKGIEWLEALGLPFLCVDQKGHTSGTLEKF